MVGFRALRCRNPERLRMFLVWSFSGVPTGLVPGVCESRGLRPGLHYVTASRLVRPLNTVSHSLRELHFSDVCGWAP